ncbi:MAG: PKD domain-containing protein [Desulfuromonadales bacterium]
MGSGWRSVQRTCLLLVVVLLTAGLAACGGSGGGTKHTPEAPAEEGAATITGQVTGSGGLVGVAVAAGGKTTTTDANGFYHLSAVPVPEDKRLVVNFAMDGRVPATRILDVAAGESYAVSVSLPLYHASETGLDPSQPQSVSAAVNAVNVLALEIPAGSLQGASGNVDVTAFYGDPTTDAGLDAFPGDFMAAESADTAADTLLESVVFTEITILDAAGKEIKDLSEPATVRLRLPDALQTVYSAGDTIPWWSFDEEQGIWVREDAFPEDDSLADARVIDVAGTLFAEARVTHLSWWNVDVPIEQHAVVCVQVRDCEAGQPLANVRMEARGVTFNASTFGTTDAEGWACMTVKQSAAEGDRERVTLWAKKGPLTAQYEVTDSGEGNVASNEIFVPREQGSTLRGGSGQENWLRLANPLCLNYDGAISGTVTYAGTGAPAAGFSVYTDVGVTAKTDAQGAYAMKVPKGNLLVYAPGVGSQAVVVGAAAVVVDFEIPNQAPVIDQITLQPGAVVSSGEQVRFTAQAQDADGDAITYAWQADVGAPTTGAGATFAWTAPTGAGTARIILTVTDDKGATVTAERSVVYGGEVGGNSLKVTLKDDPVSDQPVAGVHVVLHGVDNVAVEDYKVTGADGVADFGNVGRQKVTLTLGYETSGYHVMATTEPTSKALHTLVEMPAGDHVYYINEYRDDQDQSVVEATLTLDWGADGPPQEIVEVDLEPFLSLTNDMINYNLWVYSSQRQNDDLFSLLASGVKEDEPSQYSLHKYGFLLDQTLTAGANYAIDMDRDPLIVTWNTVLAGTREAAPIDDLSFSAQRKGVYYDLGRNWFDEPATFGTVAVAGDFPGPFEAQVSAYSGDNYASSYRRLDALTENMSFSLPDLQFANLAHQNGTISWTRAGSMAPDLVTIELSTGHEFVGEEMVPPTFWEASMAGDKAQWQVPALPAAMDGWIDRQKIGQAGWVWVEAEDWDGITGFEHLLTVYLGGDDPDALSDQRFSVEHYADFWAEVTAARVQTAGVEGRKMPAEAKKRGFGLLRR